MWLVIIVCLFACCFWWWYVNFVDLWVDCLCLRLGLFWLLMCGLLCCVVTCDLSFWFYFAYFVVFGCDWLGGGFMILLIWFIVWFYCWCVVMVVVYLCLLFVFVCLNFKTVFWWAFWWIYRETFGFVYCWQCYFSFCILFGLLFIRFDVSDDCLCMLLHGLFAVINFVFLYGFDFVLGLGGLVCV